MVPHSNATERTPLETIDAPPSSEVVRPEMLPARDRMRPTLTLTLSSPDAAIYIGMSESWLRQSRMPGRTYGPPFVRGGRGRSDIGALILITGWNGAFAVTPYGPRPNLHSPCIIRREAPTESSPSKELSIASSRVRGT